MKYIIIWCLLQTQSVNCNSSTDEFGRDNMVVTSELCLETKESCDYYKKFDNEKDAMTFYNKIKKEETLDTNGFNFLGDRIINVELYKIVEE